MAKYIANGLIEKGGKVYKRGQELELSEAQAKALATKVIPKDLAQKAGALSELGVQELRQLATASGIEGASKLNKEPLVEALQAAAPTMELEKAVEANGLSKG